VHNLRPGSRYTVSAVARDNAGRVSWSSSPLTITTGVPAQSTCTVRLTNVSDWSSGFVGSVDITNTTDSPVNGWTLNFDWPTTLQQVGSGWNGTWTQTGTEVKVVNAESTVAPGASVNIGFVGNYTGPNVLPTAFTLNGNVCAAG
jgi:cellulase/cellobiase CelA1